MKRWSDAKLDKELYFVRNSQATAFLRMRYLQLLAFAAMECRLPG